MPELKSPGEWGVDFRKFLDSVPTPPDVMHRFGLKLPHELIPTPAELEEHQHKERLALFEKGKIEGKSTPAEVIRSLLPPAPVDFGNISLLRT